MVLKTFFTIILSFTLSPALARFHHSDQNQVDQQETPGVEYYNDIDSYRYPIRWDQHYRSSNFSFRNSAGSLNQTKFLYDEQWKAISDLSENSHLSIQRRVKENYITQEDQNEVRWSKNILPYLSWRVSGEGGYFKKWGDIGTGFSLRLLDTITTSVDIWSVDHFYNTKNTEHPQDHYLVKPQSTSFKFEYHQPQYFKAYIHHDWDHPLTLEKVSKHLSYTYEKSITSLKITMFQQENLWNLTAKHTRKKEGKLYDHLASKRLSSYKQYLEIEKASSHSENNWRIGFNMRKEQHTYHQIDLPILDHDEEQPVDFEIESESPQVTRFEPGFFTCYEWLIKDHHWFSSDLWVHRPSIRHQKTSQLDTFKTTEVKLGFAWDFIISTHAQLRLNTTWDLDQMHHDFTHDNPVKPWGGGNIQLMVTQN